MWVLSVPYHPPTHTHTLISYRPRQRQSRQNHVFLQRCTSSDPDFSEWVSLDLLQIKKTFLLSLQHHNPLIWTTFVFHLWLMVQSTSAGLKLIKGKDYTKHNFWHHFLRALSLQRKNSFCLKAPEDRLHLLSSEVSEVFASVAFLLKKRRGKTRQKSNCIRIIKHLLVGSSLFSNGISYVWDDPESEPGSPLQVDGTSQMLIKGLTL